jgi:hypothetical protein
MKLSLALIFAALLASCGARSSDEEQVRELIARAEESAEARDTSDVLALVADDYADAQGRGRHELRNALTTYFALHPKLEIFVSVDSIEFPADGLAQVRVAVRGLELERFDLGESVELAVELRRDDGDWRVSRADRVRR